MTQRISENISEFIGRLSGCDELEDIRFLSAYPPARLPRPCRRYTAAVHQLKESIGREFMGESVSESLRGRIYDAELMLRLYAPENSAGSMLSEHATALMDAIRREDSEGAVSRLSVSGIGFETESRTLYRDITAVFSYCLFTEAQA